MNRNHATGQRRLLAWLASAGAALGLLLSAALFFTADDVRWGVLLLALSAGLPGAAALFLVVSAPAGASGRAGARATASPVDREPVGGLPVHPTTGLFKPWIFHERLAEEIARADRYKRAFAIVLLEPADLLMETSPEVYALAAKALRHALRSCDFAAQFDEERFAVLLPETELEGAQVAGHRLLSRLRSSSEQHVRWRGALVTYPEDGEDPNQLLDRVQLALRRGRLKSAVRSQ